MYTLLSVPWHISSRPNMSAVCCFTITPRLIVHLKYFNIKLSLTFHPYLHMVAKKEIRKKTVSGFFFFFPLLLVSPTTAMKIRRIWRPRKCSYLFLSFEKRLFLRCSIRKPQSLSFKEWGLRFSRGKMFTPRRLFWFWFVASLIISVRRLTLLYKQQRARSWTSAEQIHYYWNVACAYFECMFDAFLRTVLLENVFFVVVF